MAEARKNREQPRQEGAQESPRSASEHNQQNPEQNPEMLALQETPEREERAQIAQRLAHIHIRSRLAQGFGQFEEAAGNIKDKALPWAGGGMLLAGGLARGALEIDWWLLKKMIGAVDKNWLNDVDKRYKAWIKWWDDRKLREKRFWESWGKSTQQETRTRRGREHRDIEEAIIAEGTATEEQRSRLQEIIAEERAEAEQQPSAEQAGGRGQETAEQRAAREQHAEEQRQELQQNLQALPPEDRRLYMMLTLALRENRRQEQEERRQQQQRGRGRRGRGQGGGQQGQEGQIT